MILSYLALQDPLIIEKLQLLMAERSLQKLDF